MRKLKLRGISTDESVSTGSDKSVSYVIQILNQKIETNEKFEQIKKLGFNSF
jgi:c-di-GMP-related signal transduction protein